MQQILVEPFNVLDIHPYLHGSQPIRGLSLDLWPSSITSVVVQS